MAIATSTTHSFLLDEVVSGVSYDTFFEAPFTMPLPSLFIHSGHGPVEQRLDQLSGRCVQARNPGKLGRHGFFIVLDGRQEHLVLGTEGPSGQ